MLKLIRIFSACFLTYSVGFCIPESAAQRVAADRHGVCERIPVFLSRDGKYLIWSDKDANGKLRHRIENLESKIEFYGSEYYSEIYYTNSQNVAVGVGRDSLREINLTDFSSKIILPFDEVGRYKFFISSKNVIQLPIFIDNGLLPFGIELNGESNLLTANTGKHEITVNENDTSLFSMFLRAGDGKIIAEIKDQTELNSKTLSQYIRFYGDVGEVGMELPVRYPHKIEILGGSKEKIIVISNVNSDKSVLSEIDTTNWSEHTVYSKDEIDIDSSDVTMYPSKDEVLAVSIENGFGGFYSKNENISKFYNSLLKSRFGQFTKVKIVFSSDDASRIIANVVGNNGDVEFVSWENEDNVISVLDARCKNLPAFRSSAIVVEARDGVKLNNILVTPAGVGPWPTIIYIHGGPDAHVDNMPDEIQLTLAKLGFASFAVNYRGSSGRGISFRELGFQQFDGRMVDDVEDSINWIINRKDIFGGYLGVFANSFGSIIANGLIKKNNTEINSTVFFSSVYNLNQVIEQFTRDGILPNNIQYFRSMSDAPDISRMNSASPIFAMPDKYTNTLIIHGANDKRVPIQQARDFYKKISSISKSNTFLEIPNMDHSPLPHSAERDKVLTGISHFYSLELEKIKN